MKSTTYKFFALAILGLVVSNCASKPEPTITRGSARVGDPSPTQFRHAQAMVRIVNEYRTRNGLQPLILEAHLMRAALVKARDFRTNWRFYHAGSDGSKPEERVSRTGYGWTSVAETLAAAQPTPRGAVGNLRASPCHHFAIMRQNYLHVGAAYIYTPDSPPGRYKHWWVLMMARPSSSMNFDKTYPTAGAELPIRSGSPSLVKRPKGCRIRAHGEK
jgi:uncharacterized protein YkwD